MPRQPKYLRIYVLTYLGMPRQPDPQVNDMAFERLQPPPDVTETELIQAIYEMGWDNFAVWYGGWDVRKS